MVRKFLFAFVGLFFCVVVGFAAEYKDGQAPLPTKEGNKFHRPPR